MEQFKPSSDVSQEDHKPFSSIFERITKSLSLWVRPWQWLARRLYLQRLPRRKLGVLAAVFFAVATGLAVRQYLRPFEWHTPYPVAKTQWWLHPLEWNIDSVLPQIDGNINAIVVTRNGDCLWIAGDAGLLAYSNNQGESWTRLSYDTTDGSFRVPTGAPRCDGAPPAMSASSSWFSLTPVYAAEQSKLPPQAQQAQQSSPSQAAPPQPKSSPMQEQSGAGQPLTKTSSISPTVQQTSPKQSQTTPVRSNAPGPKKPASKIPGQSPTSATPATQPSSATARDFSKPPDLWGMNATAVFVRSIQTSTGDRYDHETDNSWQWSGPDDTLSTRPKLFVVGTSYSVSVSDKVLSFVPDSNTRLHRLASVNGAAIDRGMYWLDGSLHLTQAGHNGPQLISKPAGDLTSISAVNRSSAWAINFSSDAKPAGASNSFVSQILHTIDGGKTWSVGRSFAGERLKSVAFLEDSKTGWVAGDNGVLLGTMDGGVAWHPLTASGGWLLSQGKWSPHKQEEEQYGRFLPPWYLTVLLICGVLATPVLFPIEDTKPEEKQEARRTSRVGPLQANANPKDRVRATLAGEREADASGIGNQAIADKPLEPGDPDALGLSTIAAGLAFFLRNEKTKPPLAIAINGRWGSGKSSLMNLLKNDLEAWGAHPVWFNAWHHQKEDQMLAALLQAVKTQAVPPLWQFSGLMFRAKLVWKRLQRSWSSLVMMAAAIFLIYKAEVFVQHTFSQNLFTLLNAAFSGTKDAAKDATSALSSTPVFAILAGIASACRVVYSGLTAFGSNPASLLASVSGGTKTKDLDAQTNFRQRFATEFNEVTRSLGQNRRMLILIDDLDRCRPEKVREVLEGVNFLASSGDCFIVLGMARDIVEHCVGLSFAAVVDTMDWTAMGLTPVDIAAALQEARQAEEAGWQSPTPAAFETRRSTASLETRAKRRAFAHLYLDKLIQIEVSVPEPTALQRQMLFRSEEEIKDPHNANEPLVQNVMGRSRKVYAALQPLTAAVLAALVLFGLWTLSRPTVRRVARQITQNAPAPKPPAMTSKPSTVTTSSQADTKTAAPSAQLTGIAPYGLESSAGTVPDIKVQVNPWSKGWEEGWPFYLIALGTVSLLATSLRRLPQRIVRDEAPFTNALSIWHPLVMTGGARNTPRTARRFQNRVRYLAMRQRAILRGKAMSVGERWLRQFLGAKLPQTDPPVHLPETEDIAVDLAIDAEGIRQLLQNGQSGHSGSWTISVASDSVTLSAIHDFGMDADQFKALVLDNVYIPEPVLVALAAIDEYAPAWIQDGELFRTKVAQASLSPADPKADLLAKTIEAHTRICDDWYNLEQYRRAYLRLCSELNRLEDRQIQAVDVNA